MLEFLLAFVPSLATQHFIPSVLTLCLLPSFPPYTYVLSRVSFLYTKHIQSILWRRYADGNLVLSENVYFILMFRDSFTMILLHHSENLALYSLWLYFIAFPILLSNLPLLSSHFYLGGRGTYLLEV